MPKNSETARASGRVCRFSFLLFGCVVAACRAQINTATVSGAVTDANGASIGGADISIAGDLTGVRTAVKTNRAGFYSIPNLPVGAYTLTAQKAGFRGYVRSGIVMTTGQALELNATLELGPVNETVNVTGLPPLLETRTSDAGQLIDSKSIENLPMGNRRTMSVIQMTGAAVWVSNDNLPTYSLAGGRLQSQMVWIDGGTGQNIRIGVGQQNLDPPVEAVQEIRVLVNSYAAEYGGSAGGVVIQTTKSGGNQWHGSAYEYLRNDAMDAPGFFAPLGNGAKLAPELRYNVFGGTAGGPVRRNRTFFFAGYEATLRRTGATATLTVPTELQRNGDFSATLDSRAGVIPIHDPSTAARLPFPGNVIPRSRIDPVAANVLRYYPPANRVADTITGANNFRANSVTRLNANFWIGKLDHSLNERNKLTGRYMAYRSDSSGSSVYPDAGADPAGDSAGHSQYSYGSWTRILSSAKVNDLRYTYVNRASHMFSRSLGGNYPRKLGLSGVDPLAFPQFAPMGFTAVGSAAQERRQYPIEQHQVVESLTWLLNRHALKAGFEARRSRNYEINLPTVSGAFSFSPPSTALPGNASTGNALASMLLGLPASFRQLVTGQLDRRSWYGSGFVQDDWTAAPGLTLNLGLRWEVDTPLSDAGLRMNGFDARAINPVSLTPGVVRFAGIDGSPRRPYALDWNNFGPRLGFAWKPPGWKNTVIRGGYGIFFAHPMDGAQATAASLGFSVSAALLSPDNGFTAPFLLRNGVPPVTPESPALNDAFGAVRLGQPPTTAVNYFDRGRVSGSSQQFNLALQQELAGLVVLEAAFLGNLCRNLASANLSVNQIPADVLGPARHFQADRPFPQFSDVALVAPSIGRTNYYAGLLKAEKRLTRGLLFVGTYTWSKFLADTNDSANPGAGSLGVENGPYSNYYSRRADYGPAENDIEHRFALSSVYELPFGWTAGALATLQSGAPLTVITQTNTSNAFSAGAQRANVSREPNLRSARRSLDRWFDTGAFSQPAVYSFGNQGVGLLRAYGLVNFDFSLSRAFSLTERARLQVRGEFFNALNHTNFNPPGVVFGSPGFGVVSSAKPARQIQAGARLVF